MKNETTGEQLRAFVSVDELADRMGRELARAKAKKETEDKDND